MGKGKRCYNCRKSGHINLDCPEIYHSADDDRSTRREFHKGDDKSREFPCHRCGRRGHFARECISSSTRCARCGKSGHTHRECYMEDDRNCYICGEKGHISYKCPDNPESVMSNGFVKLERDNREFFFRKNNSNGNEEPMEISCHRCGRRGHFARECRSSPTRCARCGKPGHIHRECEMEDDRSCYNCGEKGHISYKCSDRVSRGLDKSNGFRDSDNEKEASPLRKDNYRSKSVEPMEISNASCSESDNPEKDGPKKERFTRSKFYRKRVEHARDSLKPTCDNCGESGHVKENCLRKCPDRHDVKCYSCGNFGHVQNVCPGADMVKRCFYCGNIGHVQSDCRSALQRKCFICGNFGHIQRDCRSTSPKTCYTCGDSGHVRFDCPNFNSCENGDRVPFRRRKFCWDDEDDKDDFNENGPFPRKYKKLEVICYHCGGFGHMAPECRTNPDKRRRFRPICFNCGESGHRKFKCPYPGTLAVTEDPFCFQFPEDLKSLSDSSRQLKCTTCLQIGHLSKDCQVTSQSRFLFKMWSQELENIDRNI